MEKYDVIVVGAGPAGTSAARVASERGARTILLEEHQAVGLPRHCMGKLHGSSFTKNIVQSVDARSVTTPCKSRRFFSPRGKLVLDKPLPAEGAFLVQRDEFDRELARQAAEAGANIVLGTRVTGLLREDGAIHGVTTASQRLPVVRGDMVIVAQGGKSRQTGIPMQESLSYRDETFPGGILFELARVHDLEKGVLEIHLSGLEPRGFVNIYARDSTSCLVPLASLDTLDRIKAGDSLLSKKFKDAVPIQTWGYVFGTRSGVAFPSMVKDGLILAGDSAGFNDMVHAIISGRCAGEVAAMASRTGDVSKMSLVKYEDMCKKIGLHLHGLAWGALQRARGLSDDEIESILPELLSSGQIDYDDVWPF